MGRFQSKVSGYVDLVSASYACNTTGSITLITTIPQGTSVVSRVGKRILIKSIQLRGRVEADTAATIAPWAFMLVYDKRPTGALPAITDILVSISSQSLNNDDNSGRFQILHRQDGVTIGNNTTPTVGTEAVTVNTFVKVNKASVYKAGTTGAIAEIEQGAIYLVTVGTIAAGTADANLVAAFRTRFRDVTG
jgi:hypothetical protein